MKERIEWIDLAKGMSIILVAYGHMGLAGVPILGSWLASFRMPFFFLVSGLLFNAAQYPSLSSFLQRRWSTLIRPFFIFSALVLVAYWYLEPETIVERTKSLLLNGWGGYALWFIPVLVGTEICYYLICHCCGNRRLRVAILILLAIAGYACYRLDVPNHWNICFILTSTLFYGMGNLLSQRLKDFYRSVKEKRLLTTMLICFVVSLCSFFNYPKPEFFVNSLGGGILTHICGFAGIFFMCSMAVFLSKIHGKVFEAIKYGIKYLGKNSYVVLAFHQIVLQLLANTGMMPNGNVERVLMWIIIILLIEFITRYTPQILGRKPIMKAHLF